MNTTTHDCRDRFCEQHPVVADLLEADATIYRRADALEAGDIIRDKAFVLSIISATTVGDEVVLVTEVNGWGGDTRQAWSTDYREQFEVVSLGERFEEV